MDEGNDDLDMGNYFAKYGLIRPNKTPLSANVVLDKFPTLNSLPGKKPSEVVAEVWSSCTTDEHNHNLRGGIFEYLLAAVFLREKLLPFYTQAQVQYVPNVNFDFLFWTEEIGPIVLSAKTSLRERYKQADLEALALSSVHRRSRTFLVTLERREASIVKQKIESGDVQALSDVVIADDLEFDDLIEDLRQFTLVPAPVVSAVAKGIVANLPFITDDLVMETD